MNSIKKNFGIEKRWIESGRLMRSIYIITFCGGKEKSFLQKLPPSGDFKFAKTSLPSAIFNRIPFTLFIGGSN